MAKTDTPTHVLLPLDLAAAVVRYLASRPYGEVAQLIAALQELDPYTTDTEAGDDRA